MKYTFLDDSEMEKVWKEIIPAKQKVVKCIPQFARKVTDPRCLICAI